MQPRFRTVASISSDYEIQPRFHEPASISSLARVETFGLQGMCRVFSCPGDEIF